MSGIQVVLKNAEDIDLSGQNILDIIQLVNLILEGEYESFGDLNNDDILNIQDIITLINIILKTFKKQVLFLMLIN